MAPRAASPRLVENEALEFAFVDYLIITKTLPYLGSIWTSYAKRATQNNGSHVLSQPVIQTFFGLVSETHKF